MIWAMWASGIRCHPTRVRRSRPLDHLNGAGLLWRISGGKITAMQSDWATIEIDGAQRIIHRRPSPANFVLPWRRRVPAIAAKKEKWPTDSCCQRGTRTVRLGGHVQSGNPSGRPENPRQSFPVNETLTSGLPIGSMSAIFTFGQ